MNLKEMIERGLKKKRQGQPMQEQQPARPEVSESQADLYDASRPPDTTSTRAKSTRHGKVTADKRNQ